MITNANLTALQKAGSTLHDAKVSLDQALDVASRAFVLAIAHSPFGPESDKAISNLRAISQMSKELHVMEEKLVDLYKSASQLTTKSDDVLLALPLPIQAAMSKRKQNPVSAQENDFTDVVEKTAPAPKTTKLKVTSKPEKVKLSKAAKPLRETANDAKVTRFLKTILNRKSWVSVSHAQVRDGAGIPLGSVGSALNRATAKGLILDNANGDLKLC
jgi:hypothetical protein